MAYNHGREDRKWRIWKEAEEKVLRECGVDEAVIEQIRIEAVSYTHLDVYKRQDKGLSDGLECIGGEPRGFHGAVDGTVTKREPVERLSGREVHRIY